MHSASAPARALKLNLQGEHIVLVLQLLRAWGYPVLNDDGDLVDQDRKVCKFAGAVSCL